MKIKYYISKVENDMKNEPVNTRIAYKKQIKMFLNICNKNGVRKMKNVKTNDIVSYIKSKNKGSRK